MRKRSSVMLDKAVVLCWLAFLLLNIVTEYITRFVGGVGVIVANYVFMVYFLLAYGKITRKKIAMLPLFLFLFIYVIEYQFVWQSREIYTSFNVPFTLQVWHMISLVPMIISAVQVVTRSDEEMITWIRRCFEVMIIVVSIATIGILVVQPDAIRLSAASKGEFYPLMANYAVIYGMVILLPYFFASFGENKHYRWLRGLIIALMMVCVFMAAFTIAIVGMVLGIGCYLFLNLKNATLRNVFLVAFIVFLVFFIQSGLYEMALLELADLIPNDNISTRIYETVYYMQSGEEGQTTGRFDLYREAWGLIVKHPIIGNFPWNPHTKITGHSTNLDLISSCGLIVFALYLKFIWNIVKYHLKYSVSQSEKNAVVASLIVFLFVSTFNPIWASPVIMVLFILGGLSVYRPMLTQAESGASVKKEAKLYVRRR